MNEPIRISWTQMRAHLECKQKSHLLRTGKRPTAQNLRNYFHGMVVDKIMRRWLDSPQRTAGQMPTMVDDMIDEMSSEAAETGDGVVRWRNGGDREQLRDFCIELLNRLEPILRDKILPHPYEQAKRFKVPVHVPYLDGQPAPVLLTGEMDLLVEDDGFIIWDLKGTKDDQYWRKTLGQLVFYDLALLGLRGVTTRSVGFIQPMCKQPVLPFVISEHDRGQMWAAITRMASDIWRGNNACKPDAAGCSFCEVRHACPRFNPDTDDSPTLAAALRAAADKTRSAV